ncbi:MAG: hypothetical protein HY934_06410 [Candidatus Firestonebacteria bacterium]|nr:hypothetical protein [Candidatus Firestonebacteria bacterium]
MGLIFMGGVHGLIYITALRKASGWEVTIPFLIFGFIAGALEILLSVFYIRKNVKNLDHWW